jgi:hypothetical protein
MGGSCSSHEKMHTKGICYVTNVDVIERIFKNDTKS